MALEQSARLSATALGERLLHQIHVGGVEVVFGALPFGANAQGRDR